MSTIQEFQMLTLRGKIQVFRPDNPFAPGIVEQLNALPVESQLPLLNNIIVSSGANFTLSVMGVNAEYDVVLYSLVITV